MPFQFEQGEILLVNKPYRWTSFDVVNSFRGFLRKQFGIKKIKVGHAGTLDPLATGLLILCTGKFTKRIDEFQAQEKEYTGTFTLGATTPSFDMETGIDHQFSLDGFTEEKLKAAVIKLSGSYEQLPPAFSAKKIDGKRAYDYARKDIGVEIKPRLIHIPAFEITAIRLPEVDFRIVCSKGTYIRAIARDLGETLACGAYLNALCRTRIGQYHLRDAWELEDLKNESAKDSIAQ
jgi:tRNA pseudouridine55 synthase